MEWSDDRSGVRGAGYSFPVLSILTLFVGWGLFAAPAALAAVSVTALRHFSTEGYTRVVLLLDRESLNFRSGRLKNPPRLFVDIPSGRLRPGFQMPSFDKISIARKLRVGRPGKNLMRLVIELRGGKIRHKIFTLPDPNRIVIDLREIRIARMRPHPSQARSGKRRAPRAARSRPGPGGRSPAGDDRIGRAILGEVGRSPVPEDKKRRSPNMTARFRAGLGRIVLDPGHGGRDPGASGLYGLVEKKVVLDISRRTAAALRSLLPAGNTVLLTRNRDRFIELADRTSFANRHDADVFVSIHLNSSPIRRTRGVETYLLAEASTPRAMELAARESGTTVSRLSDLQKILNDLMLRSKVTESHQLANAVQKSSVARLRKKYPEVKDLGVKRGPFYVLVGAKMPSILIEMAFITNSGEARRLRTKEYRHALSEGIAKGITRFVGISVQRASDASLITGKAQP